ncbi:DUF3888 domain-containing protein [Cytobacillus firmus]|uniref:DUF3888 domain-containing protein n=1 Tax=Cytobacillus firmus TaxID=1399 RepID=UPI00216355E4|nr:DUF3888 domain-containing protein [Cytobacillus firmus]MCS0673499.1 DUF3888 domain-containing protein [Cytobacillus firmus]
MNKVSIIFIVFLFLISGNEVINAKTINEADTELSDTLKYALINSLRKSVDKAIEEIYKDDKNAPEGLTWATYDTEVIKLKQVYCVGGLYEITLRVYPYYRAHISYGIDEVVINTEGKIINFKHLKTYH